MKFGLMSEGLTSHLSFCSQRLERFERLELYERIARFDPMDLRC